jgi:hypothetical protein
LWAFSSDGRAPASHAGGRGIDTLNVHFIHIHTSFWTTHTTHTLTHTARTLHPDAVLTHRSAVPSPRGARRQTPVARRQTPDARHEVRGTRRTPSLNGCVKARHDQRSATRGSPHLTTLSLSWSLTLFLSRSLANFAFAVHLARTSLRKEGDNSTPDSPPTGCRGGQ